MNEVEKKYLVWKDEKSAPFRELWIQALAKHEQMVKRYYVIFEKYLALEATHDQLVNARHDREVASREANLAYIDYRDALSRFTNKEFQEETGIQDELSEQEGQ